MTGAAPTVFEVVRKNLAASWPVVFAGESPPSMAIQAVQATALALGTHGSLAVAQDAKASLQGLSLMPDVLEAVRRGDALGIASGLIAKGAFLSPEEKKGASLDVSAESLADKIVASANEVAAALDEPVLVTYSAPAGRAPSSWQVGLVLVALAVFVGVVVLAAQPVHPRLGGLRA